MKIAKTISNIVYSIGVVCVLLLGVMVLFFSDKYLDPTAMVPIGFSASLWLVIGMIPMIIACLAVYIFNNLRKSKHKIRNFILVFLPGFVCLAYCCYFLIRFFGRV